MSAEREHHSVLWFTDGDIVLSAVSSAPKPSVSSGGSNRQEETNAVRFVLFRVHKSTLSRNSQIFRDMFAVNGDTLSDFNELYDGVPVVDMTDSSEDVERLLNLMYDPWSPSYSFRQFDPNSSLQIQPLLAMATKYGLDSVRDRLISVVEADWPKSFDEFKKHTEVVNALMKSRHELESLDLLVPEPAAAIMLARQFDIPSILPGAFYILSCIRVVDDWDQNRLRPGNQESFMYRERSNIRTARWNVLRAEDLIRVYRGKETLKDRCKSFCLCVDIPNQCRGNECNENEDGFFTYQHTLMKSASTSDDILGLVSEQKRLLESSTKLCRACQKVLYDGCELEARDICDELSTVFFNLDD